MAEVWLLVPVRGGGFHLLPTDSIFLEEQITVQMDGRSDFGSPFVCSTVDITDTLSRVNGDDLAPSTCYRRVERRAEQVMDVNRPTALQSQPVCAATTR